MDCSPLSPADARAILAWLAVCEGYRNFQCVRAGSDGAQDVATFLAAYPGGQESIAKLRAWAEVPDAE